MLEELRVLSQNFLQTKNSSYRRYLIKNEDFQHRLSVILGHRGVGKTTTLVQFLLDRVDNDHFDPRIFYLQADHFLVGTLSLYEIADHFQKMGGQWIAFDEIHKYPDWSKELKSIYDTFPDIHVLASGSSALEIHKGSHDLSRRSISYRMRGLSFREFIELEEGLSLPSSSLSELCENHQQLAAEIIATVESKKQKILALFQRYLRMGYYPYYHELQSESLYQITLEQNLHTTIESDLAAIYPKLTGNSIAKIKNLLLYLANSVPFTPNWKELCTTLDIGDMRTLKSYFKHLEDAELITSVPVASTKFKQVEKDGKIYLNNPNQMFAICSQEPDKGSIQELFFLNMVSQTYSAKLPKNGDFVVEDPADGSKRVFEIGGRKKSFAQVKDEEHAFLACDNIEEGHGKRIPLWIFGFLY